MSDYPDFNLDAAVAQAWDAFALRLAEIIENIDETGALTISAQGTTDAPWIRYRLVKPGVIQLEVPGNHQLSEHSQLGDQQQQLLRDTQFVQDSDGFHIQLDQNDSPALSRLGVLVLQNIYSVLHPAFLAPDQLAEILTPRQDGIAAEIKDASPDDMISVVPKNRAHLDALISQELTHMFGHTPIVDEQGDHAFRVGTTMVFVRASQDCKEIVVFSVVVHDVEGRSRAVEVINDINSESRFVRFELIKDQVFVQMSVLSQPFVPYHLRQAVKMLSSVADAVDHALATRLHGRTTFPD